MLLSDHESLFHVQSFIANIQIDRFVFYVESLCGRCPQYVKYSELLAPV